MESKNYSSVVVSMKRKSYTIGKKLDALKILDCSDEVEDEDISSEE